MKIPIPTASLAACSLILLLACGCGTNNSSNGGTPNSPISPTQSASQTLPVWTNTFDGVPFTMVGSDPSMPGAGTTSIPVIIIPVSFSFSLANVILSPESVPCGDTATAVTRITNSPMFSSITWNDGPVALGQTQFPDAFQRANFWQIISAVSPNYHVMLQPVSVLPAIRVEVPPTSVLKPNPNPTCVQQPIGFVPIEFMDMVVQQTIASRHLTADTLPVFLTYDTAFLLPGGGTFLGYHHVQGHQTFIVASYNDPGFNGIPGYSVADVAVLSHELGEWMDNPLAVNKVPTWGRFGIQPTCGNDLEVGDPLSDSIFTVPTPAFTYHIQELAYFSWFARNIPSLAVNGRYSMQGTFVTPAPSCI